jgi:hypothetical protein
MGAALRNPRREMDMAALLRAAILSKTVLKCYRQRLNSV